MRIRALTAAVAMVSAAAITGCGSSTSANPQSLLTQSKTTLDHSATLHFVITSRGVQSQGTEITGGEGDLGRPDQLQGTFAILFNGLAVSIKVATGGGKFYVEPPFQQSFTLTNPSNFGLTNPAQLIDPTKGLSGMLTSAQGVTSGGQTRVNGELLDVIKGNIPGNTVPVLPDQAPNQVVAMQAEINRQNHQLRQVSLTGPFISATSSATYIVTLTRYGEPFHVTLPST